MDGCSIYLGGGVADTRAMEQTRYQMMRNAITHANMLVRLSSKLAQDDVLTHDQDYQITIDVYELARSAEALADTLAENVSQPETLDDAEGQGRR